ncbi:MAG: TonB-dependent receptor [Tannerellaceae bacterium]|nr:TonB-dependent receptor [Tannerellaceae bacterium]
MAKLFHLFWNRKRFLQFIMLLFALGSSIPFASAQEGSIEIQGKVVDSRTGEPIIGASVWVKNNRAVKGTVTDTNGEFNLDISSFPATIVISYLGYRSEEIDVYEKPSERISISLAEDVNALDEVVVIGYQQSKRGSLTGSVSTVKTDQLINSPSVSIVDKLQGEVPGLLIASNTGVPGSSSLIRLRGATSIASSNTPIFVIDGVFISTDNLQSVDLGGQLADPLSNLNPEDIESVTVLKDASATAPYGARGANGVILITTKRGASGRTKVNLKAEFGFAKATDLWDLVTGPEFAEIINTAHLNDGKPAATRPFRLKSEGGLGLPEEQQTYDRLSDIFRTALLQTYNLSVTGGNDKTNFYLGGEYTKQEATLKLEDFSRGGFRINLDHSLRSNLKIGTSNSLSYTRRSLVRVGDGPSGFFQAALHTATFSPVYTEDGGYNRPATFDNHKAILENNDGHGYGLRNINNIYAKWDIIPGLSFKTSWSNDRNSYHEKFYYNTNRTQGQPEGEATDATSTSNVFTAEQLLNYLKTIYNKHTISAFLGNSYQKVGSENSRVTGRGFPSNEFKRISSAATQTGSTSGSSSALLSYFGGVNYSYADRYSVDLALRADGSSRVGINNRWGYFPAFGAVWNLANEKFFPKGKSISDLRLKGSIGLTGNENIGDFASLGLWNGGYNYNGVSGLGPSQLSNPSLKWETTRQWNIGFSTAFIRDRIRLEFNYYNKYTYDLLLNEPVPGKTGFSTIAKNSGEVSNKGVELQINSINIKSNSFSWNTDFSISRNKNVVEKLPVDISGGSGGYAAYKLIEGYALYSLWVWNYLGVNPENGEAIYEDREIDGVKDGKITVDDKKVVGDIWPDFEGSIRNTLSYKNLSLNFSFYYKYGNKVFNYTRLFLESGGARGTGRGLLSSSNNYWKKPGDTGVLPAPKTVANADGSYNYENQSSRVVEDGSFIRLRNVTLSYTLPGRILSRAGINRADIYVTGNNLLLFSNYSGPDPELSMDRGGNGSGLVQSIDFGTPPQPKTVLFGLNLTF